MPKQLQIRQPAYPKKYFQGRQYLCYQNKITHALADLINQLEKPILKRILIQN